MIKNYKNYDGFTLVELMISLSVILIMTMGIYSLIIISLKLNADNAAFIEATEIANQKMEQIRNLSYDDVGLTTGFPTGVIIQDEVVQREGSYNVHTSVIYQDDPYDGVAGGGDLIFADYKIVTIKVSWNGKFSAKDISIFSKIIPATEETDVGYGLLKINVVDSSGAPVPNPEINIENPSLSISMAITGDTDGKLSLPLPPDFENYEVTVTKANYGTDKTYQRDAINQNPTKPHLSIFDGLKTEESFSIDKLSLLSLKTLTNTLPENWPANNIATTTSNSKISADSDSSGNTYLAWQNFSLATSSIFIQKFNSSNIAQWSLNKKISNTDFQINPSITTTSAGDSFIAWQDNSSSLKAISYAPKRTLAQINHPVNLNSQFNYYPLFSDNYFPNILSTPNIVSNTNPYKTFFDNFKTKNAQAASGVVSFVGAGTTKTDNSRYITLSIPSGTQAGDFLIAYIHHDDSSDGPMLPPSGEGWTVLSNSLDPGGFYSDSNGTIFWKFASATETTNHKFYLNKNKNEEKAGHIRAYRGVNPTLPFDGSLLTHTTYRNNQYHSAPSKTVNNDGSMLVCGWGADTYTLANVSGGPTFPAEMSNGAYSFTSNISSAMADKSVDLADSPTGAMTYNARKNVTHASMDWCLVLQPDTLPDDVSVTAINSQVSNLESPSSNQYLGGSFVFTGNTSAKTLSGITISENGSINAILDTDNIKLYYDYDSTAPYDCLGEQYDSGLDPQFGSLSTFDAADGQATFTDPGLNVSPTQAICIYPVLDILDSANSGDTVEFYIENPSTDITIDSGTVIPNTAIELTGSTNIQKPAILEQVHYKFRLDDADEENATEKSPQDQPGMAVVGDELRLRIEINNSGDLASNPIAYNLEYAEKLSSCDAIASWTTIPTDSSKHWQIFDSPNIIDNATTSNITNGLTDENTNFKEGYLKDSSSQTPSYTLDANDFTEIEYTLKPTTNALDTNYCFRLSNAGSDLNFLYTEYPELSIVGDNNIFVLGVDNNGTNLWAIKKVNSDTGSADQRLPVIDSTETLGIATSVIAWEDNRDGDYNIYAQSLDANRNILWGTDLQITSSTTDENSIALKFDTQHNFIIAWISDETSNNEIYLNKFDLDGNMVWSNPINVTNTSVNEYSPQIDIDSSDNIYLTYYEDNSGTYNSKIKKINSTGNELWLKDVNISNSASNQYNPSIAVNNSDLFVSWTDQRESNNDIYSQKFDFSGNALWSDDQRLNVNTGTSDQNNSFITNDISFWLDNRDNEYNIYGSKIIDPNTNVISPNVPLVVTGTKKIGENPIIYEYNNSNLTTNSSGELDLMLEWDSGYSININSASSSLNIIKREPIQPIELLPDDIKTMLIYVE